MTISDRPILALLVDADNISAAHFSAILKETHKLGNPILRKIYADWSSPQSKTWANVAASEGMEPVQTQHMANQKNAADIRLVVDAMDLLHGGTFGGFVIVSSDSDFTSLAHRIRQQGLRVFGIGEAKAPEGYQKAFTKFTVLNTPQGDTDTAPDTGNVDALLGQAFDQLHAGNKQVLLSQLAKSVREIDTDYSHKKYGGATMSKVVGHSTGFEMVGTNHAKRK